jgi:hypothetical protein
MSVGLDRAAGEAERGSGSGRAVSDGAMPIAFRANREVSFSHFIITQLTLTEARDIRP